MRIIKLDATDSTNSYLKRLITSEPCEDLTVVVAVTQLEGRGQRGAHWVTEPGKNLTFSVLKKFDALPIDNRFQLNMAVSLAICETLVSLQVPLPKVKWPNDILSGTSKICGVLLENVLKGSQIRHAIIGIGLNVNQTGFHNLSNATSLKLLLGRNFNLEALLDNLLRHLKVYLSRFETNGMESFLPQYEENLFMINEEAVFERNTGETFKGKILGVSNDGMLRISKEGHETEEFDLKEVKLYY